MGPDFQVIRPLFELPGGYTIALQRHGGRLGDWARVPADAPLPPSAATALKKWPGLFISRTAARPIRLTLHPDMVIRKA